MRVERRIATLSAGWASIATLGCQTLIGADFDSARLAPAKVVKDGGGSSSCKLWEPPERPPNLQAGDSIDFTVVISHLDFGDEGPDGGVTGLVGYDLDNLCTTQNGPPSCKPYDWLSQAPKADGPRGRDDGVGNLFKQQRSVLPGGALIGTTEENAGLAAGESAPPGLLHIEGYSGYASDDHVVVEFYQVARFNAVPQPGALGDGGGVRPRFDASDHWPLVRETLLPPGKHPDGGRADASDRVETTQTDVTAFVNDRQLVAHFAKLRLPMRNVFIDVSNAVLTAELHIDSGSWRLEHGTLSSRLETRSLLAFAPLATKSFIGVALCKTDDLNYTNVKRILCESADLPAVDGDPTTPCTYTSLGMGFETSPASLGPVVDVPPLADPCPSTADPATDTCEFEKQP